MCGRTFLPISTSSIDPLSKNNSDICHRCCFLFRLRSSSNRMAVKAVAAIATLCCDMTKINLENVFKSKICISWNSGMSRLVETKKYSLVRGKMRRGCLAAPLLAFASWVFLALVCPRKALYGNNATANCQLA